LRSDRVYREGLEDEREGEWNYWCKAQNRALDLVINAAAEAPMLAP